MVKKSKKRILEEQSLTFLRYLGAYYLFVFFLFFFLYLRDIPKLLHFFTIFVLGIFSGAILKIIFHKTRPNKKPIISFYDKAIDSSFPSMHSLASICLLLLVLFYFESLFLRILFVVLTFSVFVSSYVLKKHYVIDIVAGSLAGLLVFLFSTYVLQNVFVVI